jgi:hypothetical protein
MKIHHNLDDTILGIRQPLGLYLARQHSLQGPLCVIAPCCSCHGRYHIMYLEGTGGPAIGDVLYVERDKLKEYIPLEHSVTMLNTW